MDKNFLNTLVDEVVKRIKKEAFLEVEASGRHVHLSREHINTLFGEGYEFVKIKDLSQPEQYVCKERVTITGAKGSLKNVVILGPERKDTQVEISTTDALQLGVKVPVKESGDILNTPGITISTENGSINIDKGVIVAKRHIHVTPKDAEKFGVIDKELVKVKVFGSRPLIFDDVLVRVSKNYATYMHIDYDEANACGFEKGTLGRIVK